MTIKRPAGQAETRNAASSRILFCNCAHYDIIPRTSREQILHALSQAGVAVEVVPDLCGLAAHRDPRLQAWAQMPSLTIVACFPRAVRWLFHAAGAPLPQEQVRFFNMRTQPPEEITQELMIEEKAAPSTATANHQSSIINHQSDWVPWFPVIDYDRCVNCKQCLNFCLFGVYGLSEDGRVEVHKPSGCKTNCPACARMCPRQAIIFPKYADPPINGDRCPEQPTEGEAPDFGKLTSGDVYARLRSRSAGGKRFSTQANEASLTRSCPMLDNLRRELNIPDDVLASLSPAEMQRIVAQSKQAARADAGEKDDKSHE